VTDQRPCAAKFLSSILAFGMPFIAMTVDAEDNLVCIDNRFKVAWTHPGVTLFLEPIAGTCAGERMILQDGETRCFKTQQVQYDGSWHLSALDSITAECRSVCTIESARIKIEFSVNNGFSCETRLH